MGYQGVSGFIVVCDDPVTPGGVLTWVQDFNGSEWWPGKEFMRVFDIEADADQCVSDQQTAGVASARKMTREDYLAS